MAKYIMICSTPEDGVLNFSIHESYDAALAKALISASSDATSVAKGDEMYHIVPKETELGVGYAVVEGDTTRFLYQVSRVGERR